MRDIEFYAQVLGLTDPWYVEDVDLSVETRRVDITVSHHEGRLWALPERRHHPRHNPELGISG